MADPAVKPDPIAPTDAERQAYLADQAAFEPEVPEPAPAPVAKAAPAAKPVEPVAVAAPQHSPALIRAAAEVGLSATDLEGSSSQEWWDYIKLQQGKIDRERTQPAPRSERHEPAAEPKAAPKAEPELKLAWSANADTILDPEVRTEFEQAVSPLLEEIKRLQGLEFRRQAETRYSQIDGLFAKLGAEAVYGKGGRSEIDANGPEMAKRMAVLNLAEQIVKAQGDKPNYAIAFQAAHKSLFGAGLPETTAVVEPEPKPRPKQKRNEDGTYGEVEDWERAAVAKPTNRLQPIPNGVKAAKQEFDRGLAEMAARNGTADSDEDDEF